MSLPRRPRSTRVLAPVASAALVLGLLVAAPATASAAPTATPSADATAASGTVRTLNRASSLAFPPGKPIGIPAGVQSHELAPDLDGVIGPQSPPPSAASFDTQRAAPGALAPPVAASSTVLGAPTGLSSSFEGLNLFDQRTANNGNQFSLEPPDQALCVGNGFALEATNDVLQVYRAGGQSVTPVVDLNSFYGYPAAIDRTTGTSGPFITDPVCLYDQPTNRFFLTVLTLDTDPATGAFTGTNHLDVAVSKSGNPTGGFNVYSLPAQDDGTQGTPKHPFCPCLGDYPHIGADANGIYLTTNEYSFSGAGTQGNGFNGAQIYAIAKRPLAAGAAQAKLVQFEHTGLADGTATIPGFTVWPASSPAADYRTDNGGTEYFLSSIASRDETNSTTGLANRIGFYALTGSTTLDSATGSPTLRRSLRPSEVYGVPPVAEQKAGSTPLRDCLAVACLAGVGPASETESPLDSLDSRMQQVWYAAGHVWGALGSVVRVNGQIKTGVAYFILDPGAAPAGATVTRQGYVALARNNVMFPAIATLPNGTGVMAVDVVGQDHFPSAAYVHIDLTTTSAINMAGRGVGPQDGFSGYAFFSAPDPARPRWGDYSAAAVDGATIWTGSEYIAQSCRLPVYQTDPTCGGTRATLGNWSTRLSRVIP